MGKSSYQPRRGGNTKGGKQKGLHGNRTGSLHIRAEAPVKHNKYQADGTNHFRRRVIIKGDPENTICAEAHPQRNKNQQGRHLKPFGKSMHKHTDHNHNAHQQKVCAQIISPFCRLNTIFIFSIPYVVIVENIPNGIMNISLRVSGLLYFYCLTFRNPFSKL